jgi:hypothetical protein
VRKIAIIGTAPTSRGLAPYEDASYEIWACSPGNMGQVPRVTRWFELHDVGVSTNPEHRGWSIPYYKWLNEQTFPVTMLTKNDAIARADVYPIREMIAEFGRLWFSSSIAYMMALAIREKVDEIAIFGVDMAADQEHYTAQRAGCHRFMEIAGERGIAVKVPYESSLSRPPPLYGYEEMTHISRRYTAVKQQVVGTIAQMQAQRERLDREIAFFQGANEQISYTLRTWVDGEEAETGAAPIEERLAEAQTVVAETERVITRSAGSGALGSAEATETIAPARKRRGRKTAAHPALNGSGQPVTQEAA